MTRKQQVVNKKLDAVMHEWLIEYGWQPSGHRWRHPRFHGGELLCTTLDAWSQTRAMPQLGWP